MEKHEIEMLESKSKEIRKLIIHEIATLGVGHVGGCLSAVEAMVCLYYRAMNIDPKNPKMEGRDMFVLSKGHAGPALYAVLADKGYFPIEELDTLNKPETRLPSHADMLKTPGVDMTAGSLGQGISAAVGMAKASKIKKDNARIFAMIGDGESQEGQVWEAAMAAAHFGLDNFTLFLDNNGMQIDDLTEKTMNLGDVESKWKSFGFNTYSVDGHCVESISNAIDASKKVSGKPSIIILNTVKGKGVSFIEDMGVKNHNATLNEEQKQRAFAELA